MVVQLPTLLSSCGSTNFKIDGLHRTKGSTTHTIVKSGIPRDDFCPQLVKVRKCGPSKETHTHYHTYTPLTHPDYHYIAFSPDFQTVYCALVERVYFHVVDGEAKWVMGPSKPEVYALLREYNQAMRKLSYKVVPETYQEYLTHYKGRKLAIYTRAVDNLMTRGFEEKDTHLLTFMKWEKVLDTKEKRIVPRLIQPAKPEYNVELGVYIRQ
nr:RNA-dependent RNA polymerase [Tolivirales sp.]